MSVQIVNSEFWNQWYGKEPKVCFLCGELLRDSEKVIHWMGSGGSKFKEAPFIGDTPQEHLVIDKLLKNGMRPALHIFWHVDCVPSFCRRILQDWDSIKSGEDKPQINKIE
jgi:hypothetical protein